MKMLSEKPCEILVGAAATQASQKVSKRLGHREARGYRFERMDVYAANPRRRLTGQTINIPKLCGVALGIEDIVHAKRGSPAGAERMANVGVPFTIAGSSHNII